MSYSAAEINAGGGWGNISIQDRLKQRKKGKSFHPTHKGINWDPVKGFFKTLVSVSVKVFLAMALCYGVLQTYLFVTESEYFSIAKVTFSGQNILTGEILEGLLGPFGGKSIVIQDMKALEKNLEAHPWVESASVSRRLPDTLYAHIVERTPYARIQFDDVYLLDNFGILLDRAGAGYQDLPLITGVKIDKVRPGENAATKDIIRALQTLHYLNRLEFFIDDPFNSAHIKNGYRLTFTSSNRGIKVLMTVDTIDAGFKNLKIILNAIEAKGDEVERIDISFKDKVVIKKAHTTQLTKGDN